MSTEPPASMQSILYGSHKIDFHVRFVARSSLEITVHPDLSVSVTSPYGQELEVIKSKIRKRAPWILKQQHYFSAFLPTMPPRQYVSGETHLYLGRQYRLKVEQAEDEKVQLKSGYIYVLTKDKQDKDRIKSQLSHWLKSRATLRFAQSLNICWPKFKREGVPLPKVQLRRMTKRWGSCSRKGIIYLNPELIKASSYCIDYVVMHELCHLKYSDHSKSFYKLLNRVMPDWDKRKGKLERIFSS